MGHEEVFFRCSQAGWSELGLRRTERRTTDDHTFEDTKTKWTSVERKTVPHDRDLHGITTPYSAATEQIKQAAYTPLRRPAWRRTNGRKNKQYENEVRPDVHKCG